MKWQEGGRQLYENEKECIYMRKKGPNGWTFVALQVLYLPAPVVAVPRHRPVDFFVCRALQRGQVVGVGDVCARPETNERVGSFQHA